LFEENKAFKEKIGKWIGINHKCKNIKSSSFLEWLDKLENFKKFFEIVD